MLGNALGDAEHAILLNPRFALSHMRKGEVLFAQIQEGVNDDYGACMTAFNEALAINPDD